MATYKTTKCPYCKTILTAREITYWNYYTNDVGNPIEHCPGCKKPYRTGKRKWSELSATKKYLVYFKILITIIYQPFIVEIILIGICALITSLLNKFEIFELIFYNLTTLIVTYFILLILLAIREISFFKKYIKEYY